MTDQLPKVSIIMSTYNRAAEFLPKAIESVIKQTESDFELIIVDDASTDNTKEVVDRYAKLDKRIVFFPLSENTGSDTAPKNWGITLARGEYIAYLDDDVQWATYHLEILLKAFEEDPELDVAFCESLLYQDGKQIGKAICPCGIWGDPEFDGQFLLNRNYIDTSQTMHKKEAVVAVGGWDERLEKFVDWNLWVRMLKWGAKFVHVPIAATYYYLHDDTKSNRIKSESWTDPTYGISMFKPTFSAAGCYIHLPFLGVKDDTLRRPNEVMPKVAIFTITYDRLDYTKRMKDSLDKSTKYKYDWLVFDNGSKDGTVQWLETQTDFLSGSSTNRGLSFASNYLIDKAMVDDGTYDIIVKVDNDCDFKTVGWLETMIDLWKRNHMLYMSPYPEGLVHNPGGAPRIGYSFIGPYYTEITTHIGGICAGIDARAYKTFRWKDEFLHGDQDSEASKAFGKMRYMPIYYPLHRLMHMDSTEEQYKKYPEYFERRKQEKATKVSL